ncbi:MAG TPA: substrate-binding domain-containing protein, partial [Methanocella sp.]|nr:substrate-binding domain-containing protein [Methanocella sp.]
NNLNMSQLNDIFFTGNITNWSQLTNGVVTGPIHVYAVNTLGSSVAWQFDHDVNTGGVANFINQDNINKSQATIMSRVIDDPDGISIGSLGYMNSSYKAVRVNGVSPSKATVQGATYPIRLQLYLITNGVPNGLSTDFINYVLSRDGQKLVENAGLVPII